MEGIKTKAIYSTYMNTPLMASNIQSMTRAAADDVQKRINQRFDELYMRTEAGYKPHVCLICDEFVNPSKLDILSMQTLHGNRLLLRAQPWNQVSTSLASCYKFDGYCGDYADDVAGGIESLLLSPRASYITHSDCRSASGFSCCVACKTSLQQEQMPRFAIANNYCVGTPPQCLLDLNEVEIALLTPVKTYGYCFSYTGGVQKQLKGSLSYYKVNAASIARAAMHFDVLGLHDNVVIMLYGEMTPAQQARAREKSKIRTNYILDALQWLVSNNQEWLNVNIDLQNIKAKLSDPIILDNSIAVEESNCDNNIEMTESFHVFFPDGTMSSVTGGQDSLEKFTQLVTAATTNGYDIGFRANLMKEAVTDFKDNNLVNACLLQFPYGRGGMHEQRLKSNGSFTSNTDIMDYVEHLSRLSQRQFHHELFSLILYNLSIKQSMVRSATWRVRNKCNARRIAEDLTFEEVSSAITARLRGKKRKRGDQGHELLNGVDAVARAVPHTNEAANQARRNGECLQHHFGTPSLFLTVTPDDDNSFIMQVYVQEIVDSSSPVSSLTDEELAQRAKNEQLYGLLILEYVLTFSKWRLTSSLKK